MLRSRFATVFDAGDDLFVRVHVLPRLRQRRAEKRVPQLRWRPGAPPDARGEALGKKSGIDQARGESARLRAALITKRKKLQKRKPDRLGC
jgi:hypothetical protein